MNKKISPFALNFIKNVPQPKEPGMYDPALEIWVGNNGGSIASDTDSNTDTDTTTTNTTTTTTTTTSTTTTTTTTGC